MAALIVDDASCFAPPRDDGAIWALDRHPSDRFRLDSPRRVGGAWAPAGSGDTVDYERSKRPLCVKPLRLVDPGDAVMTRETVLGDQHGAGVVVALGADGSILPPREGAEYIDTREDIRCAVTAAGTCLPRRHGLIEGTPVVGATVTVISSDRSAKWGVFGGEIYALLAPADPKGKTIESRKVLSLLSPDAALHFTPLVEGEGRVVLHTMKVPDGRRVPVSLHDTHLERDCVPTKTDDGRWRCVVPLPATCQLTRVGAGDAQVDALSPSSSFCEKRDTCCTGGAIWFPGRPAGGPIRGGIDPNPLPQPAVPGRAARFATTPRTADHVTIWQPQIRALVYDVVEELGADAFAELRMVQDP